MKKNSDAFIVTILFKNGSKFVGRFSKFEYKSTNGTISSLVWTSAPNKKCPQILMTAILENITAIWYENE